MLLDHIFGYPVDDNLDPGEVYRNLEKGIWKKGNTGGGLVIKKAILAHFTVTASVSWQSPSSNSALLFLALFVFHIRQASKVIRNRIPETNVSLGDFVPRFGFSEKHLNNFNTIQDTETSDEGGE